MNTFILSLFTKEDKLKAKTLFQILVGKRTSSVLSYAYFHDLLHLFGCLPNLTEELLETSLNQLKEQGILEEEDGQWFLINEQDILNKSLLEQVDYFKFGRKEMEIWRSVQFLVQAVSFLATDKNYVPIESSPFYTERVRQIIYQYRDEIKETLYVELKDVFTKLNVEQANLLAGTFSGNHRNGEVFFQLLPEDLQEEPWKKLSISCGLHSFCAEVQTQKPRILYSFLKPLFIQNLNKSMLVTRKMLQSGASVGQVMQQRRLKLGTVQDHIIEWALLEETFPFEKFIDNQQNLMELPEDSWKQSYKELVEQFDSNFLEIRLYQIWRKGQC